MVNAVTACSVNYLLFNVFFKCQVNDSSQHSISYDDWLKKGITESPVFQYWFVRLELDLSF